MLWAFHPTLRCVHQPREACPQHQRPLGHVLGLSCSRIVRCEGEVRAPARRDAPAVILSPPMALISPLALDHRDTH